ncbi:MAG: signal peptidase I [Candidatus Eremiobacteraeota bacterium]|nr:signal peptidase I [Candidatus Eremiobacteraeota bacterium]
MTPLQLFGLICIFAVVRLALSLRPAPVTVAGQSGEATDGVPAAAPQASALTVVREYLDAFIVAGLVALFLITFVVRTFFIPSGSMEPTLQVHDVLLVNEFEYRLTKPHDGDIVVFPPPLPTTNDFIKRLIAGPGETLRVHNGIVYRNGKALYEPYIAEKPNYELEIRNYGIYVDGTPLDRDLANIPPPKMWSAPDRIPANCYFMMGDNRNNSEDSHLWGFAQVSGSFASGREKGKPAHFTGHAFLLFWPPNRIRILH